VEVAVAPAWTCRAKAGGNGRVSGIDGAEAGPRKGDVNRRLLTAVLHIIESWMDVDEATVDFESGAITNLVAQRIWNAAGAKYADGLTTLESLLPAKAHSFVLSRLESIGPDRPYPVGSIFSKWEEPDARLQAALSVMKDTHDYLRKEQVRAAEAAAAAERARVAAEAARAEAERAERERAERAARLARFRVQAEAVFQQDFLSADAWFTTWDTNANVTATDFLDWKAAFVRRWAREILKDDELNEEQARAVATTGQHLRITARAGSGKTRAIVTRAIFLQLHCGVDPSAIAVVAFNRKAVSQIETRIANALPAGARLPHIVTFHALAYALLKPEEELVMDDQDASTLAQSSKVQAIVDDLLIERPHDIRRAMLTHFTDEWEYLVQRGFHLDRDEFFAAAAVSKVTLGGEWVKSAGERLIANTLFKNGIAYRYERNYTSGGFNYRPDFTILDGNKPKVVIEYFGLAGKPKYDELSAEKRKFWQTQPHVAFLEFVPDQLAEMSEDQFRDVLLRTVREADIQFRTLTRDEVWERARGRAIDEFSKTLKTFISRARQRGLPPDDLRGLLADRGPGVTNVHFLRVAIDAYEEYLHRATVEQYDDFSGIMWRSTEAVTQGATTWTRQGGKEHGDLKLLKHLHIDEFQDFSAMFMAFTKAIRHHAPKAVICAVGDDWQAINGFAGADLTYFNDFPALFEGATKQDLATNYRSPRSIVEAGNAAMRGLGHPALAHRTDLGSIQVAHLTDFAPTAAERGTFFSDFGTPALIRLIQEALEKHPTGKVAVLFRRNAVSWFTASASTFGGTLDGYLTLLRRYFDEETGSRLDVTTAHKYKGSEADVVIVAGADVDAYPLIHPTAELFEIFGDTRESLVEDERRLFYVATTRAEQSLIYLVTEVATPFLEHLKPLTSTVDWHALQPAVTTANPQLEVRVHDAYEVREQLRKPYGFTYDPTSRTWFAIRPAENFDFAHVRSLLGFVGDRLIEVLDGEGTVLHSAGRRLSR
jgi:DNA helicase-4